MIETLSLLRPLHAELLGLLRSFEEEDWSRPTICGAWQVRDVTAHLLDTTLRRLSLDRDRLTPPPADRPIQGYGDLVAFLDQLNAEWVRAARRLSPRVLIGLLEEALPQVADYFEGLEPHAEAAFAVSWAGEERSEAWFDIGREYTEQWLHQQHLRLATGRPLLREREWMHPVLALFVRAIPRSYAGVAAPEGTRVRIAITGEAGGTWDLVRGAEAWSLGSEAGGEPASRIEIADTDAWLLFSKGLRGAAAEAKVRIAGDEALGRPFLGTLAIMG